MIFFSHIPIDSIHQTHPTPCFEHIFPLGDMSTMGKGKVTEKRLHFDRNVVMPNDTKLVGYEIAAK